MTMNKITGVLHSIILNNNNNYDDAATCCVKFGLVEDKYIKRWQHCIKFGWWITAENETDRLKPCVMNEVIEEPIHSLLQAGNHIWKKAVYHLPPQRS